MAKFKVIPGGKEVALTQSNFVAAGGEGKIYAIGDRAYKVYLDPARMVPEAKIQELGAIASHRVIRPESLLVDGRGTKVGYDMKYVPDSVPVQRILTKTYRAANGLGHDAMQLLVQQFRNGIVAVHDAKCLIVDMSERNIIVSSDLKDVFLIDADSYQTPKHRATAITPSIQDHQAGTSFTQLTDWYSFAIVSFWLFTGIHPFKGKHDSYKKGTGQYTGADSATKILIARMTDNVSVLDKGTRIPGACYPFSVIPPDYFDWYKAVFEKGDRIAPPDVGGVVAVVITPSVPVKGTEGVAVIEVWRSPGPTITNASYHAGATCVATETDLWLSRGGTVFQRLYSRPKDPCQIAWSTRSNPVIAWLTHGTVKVRSGFSSSPVIDTGMAAKELVAHDGRLYARGAYHLMEITLNEIGGNLNPAPHIVSSCLEHASRLYEGVLVQNLLGSVFVSLLAAVSTAIQVRIPELDKYKVIEAKYDSGVLVVVGERIGEAKYDRLTLRFSPDSSSYRIAVVQDITPVGINFVTLDSGVCILMNEDEVLELFSNSGTSTKVKQVDDVAITGDMRLIDAGHLHVFKGDSLYRLEMR